jgi:hypothetical protein
MGESVMAKNVLVTIWERNTKETQCRLSDDQTLQVKIQNRMACIEGMIGQAEQAWPSYHNWLESLPNQAGLSPADFDLHLFVAPEYLFAKSAPRPYINEMDKEIVRACSTALASSNSKLILIPGTVLWAKSMIRPEGRKFRRGTEEEKTTPRDFSKHRKPTDFGLRFAPQSAQRQYQKYRNQVFSVIDQWTLGGPSPERHMARNTAFVCMGDQVVTQHKRFENIGLYGLEEPDNQSDWTDLIFVPGTSAPIPLKEGLRLGLEICAEHACKPALMFSGGGLDFHVLISASIEVNPAAVAAKRGGYVIHADSSGATVYEVGDGKALSTVGCSYQVDVYDSGAPAGTAKTYMCIV